MQWRCLSRSTSVIMVTVLSLGFGVLLGCQSGGSYSGTGPQGAILDQWSERISNTGLVVIAPPMEDVRVGDIYAFSVSPDQLAAGSESARRVAAKRPPQHF